MLLQVVTDLAQNTHAVECYVDWMRPGTVFGDQLTQFRVILDSPMASPLFVVPNPSRP